MYSMQRRFAAELLGTFFLVFIGCGAAITAILIGGHSDLGAFGVFADWIAVGLAFGLALAAGIYAFGKISGAHLNPAVSIALVCAGKFSAKEAVVYIIAQLIGALIAALLWIFIYGADVISMTSLAYTAPGADITAAAAVIAEIIGTFVLMSVVMGVCSDEKGSPISSAMIIGLTVGVLVTLLGNITGGSLNPARSFGPAVANILTDDMAGISAYWIYIVGPVIGALLAAFVYKWISAEN